MRVIDLQDVSYSYGNEVVLQDISLKVENGDFLAIIGPNGSGKTTLLKIILNLLAPTKGSVKLFEKPVSQFKEWSKIGFVPQNILNIDPNFPSTVKELVSTGVYSSRGFFKQLTSEDWVNVEKSISLVGLQDFSEKQIGQLSGGQLQRAFIAKALATNPELLILDEPTSGIDLEVERDFYSLLSSLNKKGVTIIIVSHDIGLVSEKVKNILCIDKRTSFHGNAESFKKLVKEHPEEIFPGRNHIVHHHH